MSELTPVWWRWRFKNADGSWSKWIALQDFEEMKAFTKLMAANLKRGTHELQPLYAAPPVEAKSEVVG